MAKYGVFDKAGYQYGDWHIDRRDAEWSILSYKELVRDELSSSPLFVEVVDGLEVLTKEEAEAREWEE